MDCVRAQQMIRPYLEGILSDRDLEEFLDHVQGCQNCFGELEVYFSIYRTLNNVDEQGDYNYAGKLRTRLQKSREYLRVRRRNKAIKVGIILTAELAVAASFYELFRLPGGYLDRHRTEIIQVVETENANLELTGQSEQIQSDQAARSSETQAEAKQQNQSDQQQLYQLEKTG